MIFNICYEVKKSGKVAETREVKCQAETINEALETVERDSFNDACKKAPPGGKASFDVQEKKISFKEGETTVVYENFKAESLDKDILREKLHKFFDKFPNANFDGSLETFVVPDGSVITGVVMVTDTDGRYIYSPDDDKLYGYNPDDKDEPFKEESDLTSDDEPII